MKKHREGREVLFIDASKLFEKQKKQNVMNEEHIGEIFKIYRERKNVDHIARAVPCAEVLANGANLSVSSYIEPENKEEPVDIEQLNKRIAEIVERQNALRRDIDRIIAQLGRL